MKQSDDQTLFAWQLGPDDIKADKCGPLATSPSQFRGCSELVPLPDLDTPNPYSITNKGLRIVLPILEQTTEKGSVAILYCSTLAAYPSRIVLPLVLTDEQGSSYFARDNTYLGPLGYIELSRSKSAAMKTIFMRQEPEQMGGWRPGLRIKLHKQLHSHFKSTFFNPMIPTEEGDIQSWDDYNVPSDCRRGSILLSNSRSFVLILVDIELQHVGQYSCRVISNTPNWRDTQQVKEHKQIITNLGEETQQQLDTSALGTNDEVSATFQPADIAPSAGQRNIPYLHDCYTSGSNSRQSSCKLDGIGLVYASIAPQIIRGQSMLVLSIELHEPSRDHDPLCELEGSLGIISDRFAPGKMDTVPVLGRSYLQSLLHLRREGSS
jgi:hypothetical protein